MTNNGKKKRGKIGNNKKEEGRRKQESKGTFNFFLQSDLGHC